MPQTQTPSKSGGLGRKAGPLPVWAWAAIALLLIAFFVLRKPSAASAAPATAQGSQALLPAPDASGGGGNANAVDPATAALLQALNAGNEQLLGGFLSGNSAFQQYASGLGSGATSSTSDVGGDGGGTAPTPSFPSALYGGPSSVGATTGIFTTPTQQPGPSAAPRGGGAVAA